jgi:hypothetical protein
MSSAVLSASRPAAGSRGARVRQLTSHAHLYDTTKTVPAGGTRRDVPDAIIVPASRPASALDRMIALAAYLGTELVVLCSGQADVDQVEERMGRRLGARGVVVRIGEAGPPLLKCLGTSGFEKTNAGRHSDLSLKRNVGLLLARLRGWSKIVFIDDDITLSAPDVERIARQLDRSPIAGMQCNNYPDNSVVCHARRLAKLPQDVFLSGAVLGVNTAHPDLAFFPDIYNEDWFFFGGAAARHVLPKPGVAHQTPYDPYLRPDRARHEEFGDLLAEGLYAFIQSSRLTCFDDVVACATERYWSDFIEVRQEAINEVSNRLVCFLTRASWGDDVPAAIASLDASSGRYDDPENMFPSIVPSDCVAFLDAWRDDILCWRKALPEPSGSMSTAAAMGELEIGITDYRSVR